jgi:hypothetical protein
MTETLADELAERIEDDRDRRAFCAITDVLQTHLTARWWA